MKTFAFRLLLAVLSMVAFAAAQAVVPLYPGIPPGSTEENYPEKQYFSKSWNTDVVANVTRPSLTIFKPSPELRNGTAVVICPGGGFMALSIASEGTEVAKYLAAKGVTAFVLKYRLAHTGEDATQEFTELFADRPKYDATMKNVIPLARADGLAAVAYVRQHAAEWGISPDQVGIIGFSAGGFVAAGVAVQYTPESRPAFVPLSTADWRGTLPFPPTRRPCLSPPPRTTVSAWLQQVLPSIRNGRPLKSRLSYTCTPRAATDSERGLTTFPPTTGSTDLQSGCNSRAS
jgi:acetyl esterase/lipase